MGYIYLPILCSIKLQWHYFTEYSEIAAAKCHFWTEKLESQT